MTTTTRAGASARSAALDAYRGFVMLTLVAIGGLNLERLRGTRLAGLADQLQHRAWEGCAAWDLIQPAFMFIVGVAMPLAHARRPALSRAAWSRAGMRAFRLAALGMLLDTWHSGLWRIELISVLQQIAFAYVVASLVLGRGPRVQAALALALLGAHTAAFFAYDGGGASPWDPHANVGLALDRALHLPVDPEGYATFNAVASTATVLFGVVAGELLMSAWSARRKIVALTLASTLAMAIGLVLSTVVPMIKHLWTASFGLFSTGAVALLLLVFYVVIDVLKVARWSWPFVVVGTNSIAIYVFSGLFTAPLRALLLPVARTPGAPLIVLALEWTLCFVLYRRRIFLKV